MSTRTSNVSPSSSTTFHEPVSVEVRKKEETDKATDKRIEAHEATEAATAITWTVGDPENPRNWPNGKRWTVTAIVSLFTFIRYEFTTQARKTKQPR